MKPESAASVVAAVVVHGLLLFGFHMDSSARPLAMSDDAAPVDVSLVESAPEPPAPPAPPAAAPTPAAPLPTPEPAEPEPTPEISTPPPAPTATPEPMSTPEPLATAAPQAPEQTPRPRAHRHSIPHTAPSSAAALAGAASHAAPGHGIAGGRPSSGAHYLSNPKPEYPEQARALHQQGVVLLDVEVGADGRPSDVTVSRSSGFMELDESAMRAVRRWTFEPARAAGLPVSSRVVVPVHFSLEK